MWTMECSEMDGHLTQANPYGNPLQNFLKFYHWRKPLVTWKTQANEQIAQKLQTTQRASHQNA
jgi:hypothetical protein